jgi:hypothetical protein
MDLFSKENNAKLVYLTKDHQKLQSGWVETTWWWNWLTNQIKPVMKEKKLKNIYSTKEQKFCLKKKSKGKFPRRHGRCFYVWGPGPRPRHFWRLWYEWVWAYYMCLWFICFRVCSLNHESRALEFLCKESKTRST